MNHTWNLLIIIYHSDAGVTFTNYAIEVDEHL